MRRGGFSVVELLVVVTIIIILTLSAVGGYTRFAAARHVESGAESIRMVLNTARSYAISTNRWHRVVFQFRNPMTGQEDFTYWIDDIYQNTSTTPNPASPGTDPGILKPKVTSPEPLDSVLRIASVRVDNGVTNNTYDSQTNNAVVVRFKPDGSSDGVLVNLLRKNQDRTNASNYTQIKVYSPSGSSRVQLAANRG